MDPGIPSDRHSMCAVVGTDAFHTEFNVYLLGGQNDTATPGDIWALTMPGQVAQHTNNDFCLADFCLPPVPCGSAWDHWTYPTSPRQGPPATSSTTDLWSWQMAAG